ncbi:MAG: hypothetical protein Q7S13_05940 [Candidatus Omnitrophota bacterium]|jgi:hypothetical protein|nr:hypothetical protein [Candidatus Omnitrophota bacterium]
MIYWIAKTLQALGLGIILISFIRYFPGLMNYRTLAAGLVFFLSGWIIQYYLLRK